MDYSFLDNIFFRIDVFLVLFLSTLFVVILSFRLLEQYKWFTFFFFLLYFVFSGFGASFLYDLYHPFVLNYVLGLIGIFSGFVISNKLFPIPKVSLSFNGDLGLRTLVLLYVFVLLLIPMVYPEFRLLNLFIPKIRNIDDILVSGFSKTSFEVIVGYLTFLFFIFFCDIISKKSLKKQFLLVFLYLYFVFSQNGGLARGTIVMSIVPLFILYVSNRKFKKSTLIVYTVLLVFAILYFASYMTILRSGNDFTFDSFLTSFEYNIYIEFSFPRYYEKILENYSTDNFSRFYSWLVSLPIPKVFFPAKPVYNFNEEISTLLNGLTPGSSGYFVELSGIVNEGVYIAGKYLFLHLIICSSLIFYIIKIIQHNKENSYMLIYYSLFLAFITNRAGFTGFFASTLVPMIFYFVINYSLNIIKRS